MSDGRDSSLVLQAGRQARWSAETCPHYSPEGLAYPWFVQESLRSKRLVLDHAPLIIAPSDSIRKYLVLNGVEPQRVALVRHGIKPIGRILMEPVDGRPISVWIHSSINPPKDSMSSSKRFNEFPDEACELHVFGEPQYPGKRPDLKKTMSKYSEHPGSCSMAG